MDSGQREQDRGRGCGGAAARRRFGSAPALAIAIAALAAASPAAAYRPFDLTDAAVAEPGELEIEFGPVGHLRIGSASWWLAPALVANFGLRGERELVLEGKWRTPASGAPDAPAASVVDTALSLKQVLRPGSLQERNGPSIASECSVLLPTWHDEPGMGAGCTAIVSQQWSAGSVHLDGGLTFDRHHRWTRLAGAIVEGPARWPVRPVAEHWVEREAGGAVTQSSLLGAIWRVGDHLAFDAGLRRATEDASTVREIRVGLTWSGAFAQ